MERNNLAVPFDVKFAVDAPQGVIGGYGSVFGNKDFYGDVIQKGAFLESLAASEKSGTWPAMLMQHGGWGMGADDMTPIGIWTSMSEDEHGLKVEGKLALDTQRGKEAYSLLSMKPRPALNGLSIGFFIKEFTLGTKPEEPRRTIKKLDLVELSVVTFPANPKALIADVKSIRTIREFETFLRDAGRFSREAAKEIALNGFKAISEARDAPDDSLAELAALLKRNAALIKPNT